MPEPKNELEFEIPELEEFKKKEAMLLESSKAMDAEDLDKIIALKNKERSKKSMLCRSKAVRFGLPRPQQLPQRILNKLKGISMEPNELIERETIQMIVNDAIDHPLGKRRHPEMQESYTGHLNLHTTDRNFEGLKHAEDLIDLEVQKMLKEEGTNIDEISEIGHHLLVSQFKQDWSKVGKKKLAKKSKRNSKKLKKLESSVSKVKEAVESLESQTMQQETLLNKEDAIKKIEELTKTISNKQIEIEVYKKLKEQEHKSAATRIGELDTFVNALRNKERKLQQVYKRTTNDLEDLG